MENIEGKVALITGASRGIGAAIAKELVQAGAKVIANYKTNHERAQQVKEELDGLGKQKLQLMPVDVGNSEAVHTMIETILHQYGTVDIVISNAGIRGPVGSLEKVSLEEWQTAMQVNYWGPVSIVREALPKMKEQKYGRIVFISANLPEKPCPAIASYTTSKGALNAFALQVAAETGSYNITSNIITPGPIQTDLGSAVAEVYLKDEKLARDHFMIPTQIPTQAIGETVVLLCQNAHLTAQNIYVDHGWQRRLIVPRR